MFNYIKAYDIYIKITTISRSTSRARGKTTPVVAQILNLEKPLELQSLKWGVGQEQNALKAFYAEHYTNIRFFKQKKVG